MTTTITIEELKKKLDADRQELHGIESLLEEDPTSEELHVLKDELLELIKKSSDLMINLTRGVVLAENNNYGNSETLTVENIRPPSRQKLVPSIKDHSSRYSTAADTILSIPKSLKILPEDSEEVRKQKEKKQHSIRTQNRADEEHRKKKQQWKDFQAKPKKSIPGTFTDKKKGSMFSTPDNINGRVGVIGSGRGMTENATFSLDKKKPNTN
eukprot:gene4285-5003_t